MRRTNCLTKAFCLSLDKIAILLFITPNQIVLSNLQGSMMIIVSCSLVLNFYYGCVNMLLSVNPESRTSGVQIHKIPLY